MNTKTIDKQQLTGALLLLADFYKPPTMEFYQSLKTGSVAQELKPIFQDIEESFFQNAFPSYENMKQVYLESFIGPNEPFAPPIESLYKQWTDDASASVSFAKQKGYFFGDPALHVQYLYQQFRLELPDEYKPIPDHLTLLLEFLVLLVDHGSADSIQQFITDHFDWLEDFMAELMKAEQSTFYVSITQLVNQLVHSYSFDRMVELVDVERSE